MTRERRLLDDAQLQLRMGDLFTDAFPEPLARATDPITAHAAAARAALRASPGRLKAMRALAVQPLTDFELAARTGLQQTSIGKRRHECMTRGFVRASTNANGATITRAAPSGSQAIVWEITDAGADWLAGVRE